MIGAPKPAVGAIPGASGRVEPRLWPAAVVGAFGSALLAFASNLPRSPYGPEAAGVWPLAGKGPVAGWEGPQVPWWATVANRGPGVDKGHALPAIAAVAGVVLLLVGWVLLLRTLRDHGPVPFRRLWLPLTAWAVPLFFAAPFASQDVWIYGAQGKLALTGVAASKPVSVLGHSTWLGGVDPKWAARPSIYGPGALGISALLVELADGHPWIAAECWRVLVVASLAVVGWSVARTVSARNGRSDRAVIAGVANPGVLIVLLASVHNDAVMVALVAAGVALVVTGRSWWGMALCAVAVTVKAPAALALLGIAWWAWRDEWWRRLGRALGGVAFAVVLLAAVGLGVGGGFAWVRSASVGLLTSSFSVSGGLFGVTSGGASDTVQIIGVVLAVALVLKVRPRLHWVGGLALGFAAMAFFAVNPQPWYLPWIVVLLCCEGTEPPRQLAGIAVLVVMMAWSELPFGTLVWFLGLVALVWIGAWSEREWRGESAPAVTA